MRPRELRSILVASDLSATSDRVVLAAAELAERSGAELHVVHAIEILGRPFWEAAGDLTRLRNAVGECREALRVQLTRVLPDGVTAGSVKLDYQNAPAGILRRAREVKADLIVVGPHRARVPGSHLLGTTAQRVVEEATVPCLVTRGPLSADLRRVLVPVGEVDVRRGLLAAAAHWLTALRPRPEADAALAPPTQVRVFHVVKPPLAWADFSKELERELERLVSQPLLADGFRFCRGAAWSRSPAAEILRTASDARVDLIAMGIRGHGLLMRALLGSVSADVLRQATAPVLLIPPRLCERWAGWDAAPAVSRPAMEAWELEGGWEGRGPGTDPDEIRPPGMQLPV